jgi:hypothetical protein
MQKSSLTEPNVIEKGSKRSKRAPSFRESDLVINILRDLLIQWSPTFSKGAKLWIRFGGWLLRFRDSLISGRFLPIVLINKQQYLP